MESQASYALSCHLSETKSDPACFRPGAYGHFDVEMLPWEKQGRKGSMKKERSPWAFLLCCGSQSVPKLSSMAVRLLSPVLSGFKGMPTSLLLCLERACGHGWMGPA